MLANQATNVVLLVQRLAMVELQYGEIASAAIHTLGVA